LRTILPSQKYDEALITTNITSLRDRREKLCEHFFEKNIDNEKLKDLLPQTILSGYDLRPSKSSEVSSEVSSREETGCLIDAQTVEESEEQNKSVIYEEANSILSAASIGTESASVIGEWRPNTTD
jgi:hypothetical protein